jgi:hypothetical protein
LTENIIYLSKIKNRPVVPEWTAMTFRRKRSSENEPFQTPIPDLKTGAIIGIGSDQEGISAMRIDV